MTTGNPNAPGFFKEGVTGGSRGTSPTDLYVVSGAVNGQNLVLTLSNSTTVTISLGTVFEDAGQVTGLSYDEATERLTINQGGRSISTTIMVGDTNVHVQGLSFNPANNILTASYTDGRTPITVDLSRLDVVANSGNTPTLVLDTLEVDSVTYRVGGSTPAHARLRTSVTLSPNSIQLPRLGTVIVTGSVSASIENPLTGDVINDVIIHSVHSSYEDSRTGTPTVVSDTESTFSWNFQVGDPAQVVAFTVSYSVSGIIDGQIERSVHNDTVTLPIIAEPQHFWTGTVSYTHLTLPTNREV